MLWEVLIKSTGEHEAVIYTLAVDRVEVLDFDMWPPFWGDTDPDV